MSASDSPQSSLPEPASPLTVDQPDSISELFARDPSTWEPAQMDKMLLHLRELRKDLGPDQKPKAKAAVAKEKAKTVDLAALGLLGKRL